MDLIKDISSLNGKIDDLRQKIADYDKQLNHAAGMSKNIERMFTGFKSAKASAMDISGLTSAVQQLTSGYNELTNAQGAAIKRQEALQKEMRLMGELQSTLAAAQRESLIAGDQQGAADLYKQYVATGKAMSDLQTEIELTGSTIVSLNGNVVSSEQVLNRYNQVLNAATQAGSTNSIEELNALFEEEKKKVQKVCDAMNEYKEKYDTIKEVESAGGLNPKGMEKAQAELASYNAELQRLSEEYTRAAETAQVYADALGLDRENSIPEMPELPKVEAGDSEKAAKNMKDYADAAGDASTKLEDLFRKGAALGGLSYGVHKLKELGQQVMHTRSEFQQLEVAFTTMLGSKSKADALMQQLTKTAATTPFDLQSVSRGAKQLLAYGTAAGDVNDILIHLGDVAAGLSQPLDALVYLYGTTMVQGKMMTRDLLQFQNRGIPIAEELAKQFGVAKSEVQGLVSAGRVTADEFHKAVMGMANDGGKFAGLMEAQSKTIGGQISNIEDSIDMMFNEIGKSSEGIINMGLSGVSKLVENYESVGRTILNLVAVYGTYKTALIIVSALEAARSKQAKFAVVTGGKQITITNLLVKSTYKQIAAQLKLNAAMLANPAVAIATGLAVLVGIIITATRIIEKNADVTGKVNKKYDERVSKLNEEKDAAEQHIAVLKDETAANYELMHAKDALSKMDLLKGKNLAGMTPEMIQQELDKAYQEKMSEAENERLKGFRESLKEGKTKYNYWTSDKVKNKVLNSTGEAIEGLTGAEFAAFSDGKTYAEQVDFINEKIKAQNAILDDRNKKLEEYGDLSARERGRKYGEGHGEMYADWQYEFKMAEMWKNNWLQILANIEDAERQKKDKDKEENTGVSLNQVINGYTTKNKEGKDTFVNGIVQQEKKVDELRKKYAEKASNANKKELESAEANLKELTEKYKNATGQTWTSTKEMTKQTAKEIREAARQQTDIQQKEYSKRVQLAEKYKRDLEDIDLEEEEWKEKNPNRPVPSSFARRKAVVEAQYDFDKEQLDKEFNEWIESVERENINLQVDIDIANLERQMDLATSTIKKKELRKQVFEKQLNQKKTDLDKEERETAKEKFGEDTIKAYKRFNMEMKKEGGGEWTQEEIKTFQELFDFYAEFNKKREATITQMTQEHDWSEFNEQMSNYENYLQGMLDAEQQYQEELARIREENGLKADTDIENNQDAGIQAQVQKAKDQRDTAQKIIKRDTGITDDTWVTELGELGAKVAGKAYDEVKKLYDEFIQSVNDDIAEVEAQKVAAENIASGGDAKTLKEEAKTQLGVVETQLLDPNLSKEKKVELLQQELELKAQIAYYDAVEQGNAESLNSLTERGAQLVNVRNRAEKDASNAQQKADTKTLTRQQKISVSNKAVVDGLTSVRDMANAVANTFGGALSKKSKKALTAMTLVADFGIDAVKGIETIVNGVSNGMIKTTEGASKSMQALEKASFILTVISLAVQLIMKIAEIASQFTKSAQLQNSIDDHLAKVEELKKQQALIESQYATSQGSDYYKGLVKSGKEYKEIIEETNEALADAEALYYHNKNKYGEDSDKTKDAKAQLQDIQQQKQDNINAEIELWRSLMEEISGTSLDSFAENLADALIEGFKQGKEEINDVWEDTMDDLLRTMMRNQLAIALKDQFEDAFKSLENATKEDGVLSDAEMQEFMNNLEAGKEKAEQIAGAYYDAMSEAGLLNDADAEGSEGFGQMTQDQADTLTARFTAVQMEMANVSATTQAMAGVVSLVGEDIKLGVAGIQSLLYNSNIALQMAQDQLDQMQVIADNTAMLVETNTRLKAIETNTSRL